MKDSKKLETFKDALQRAKKGDLFNYDKWLKDNDVNPKTLNLKYFQDHFRANPDKTIGNENIIQKVAEYIGHFLKEKKGIYHIPIIGINGSGKSLLLRILRRFTNEFETNLGTSIDIIQDGNFLLQPTDLGRIITSPDRVRIYFIDNCEKDDRIVKILENILKIRKDSVYITSWTPETWIVYKEKINEILPISEEFILYPFEVAYTPQQNHDYFLFMGNLLHSIMPSQKLLVEHYPHVYPKFLDIEFFNENLLYDFYKYSWGIPLITIKLLISSIEKVYLLRKEELQMQIIDQVAEEMGLKNIEERLNNLSELHLVILMNILWETQNKGVRPMQLVKEFDLDKSTISYHLNILKELELVKDEKLGKSKFYKVKENLIPFVQLKILNEIYLKKQNIREE